CCTTWKGSNTRRLRRYWASPSAPRSRRCTRRAPGFAKCSRHGSAGRPMTCEGMDSLLDDYVDGALDAPARQSVDAHLAGCVACRRVVDATRGIRETAARLERHAPPP